MKMHFVHKSENDALAVIAVLIENGRYNTAFDPIWQYLPSVTGESEQIAGVVFNAMDFAAKHKAHLSLRRFVDNTTLFRRC